jgi:hypothetical protein
MTKSLSVILLCLALVLPSAPTAGAAPAPSEPSVAIQLTAMAVSDSQIALTWIAPAGAAWYRIYRDGASLGTTRMISEFDRGLKPETRYCYRVSALDGKTDKEFSLSNKACATTSASESPASAQAAVVAAAPKPHLLEDIHFDFDKFDLKP